jgi:hypothetical protein
VRDGIKYIFEREIFVFGYVKVKNSELRVREYEVYRGAYCGLCRSMGKCTGQCSRMTLSYDFAFLVMLRICLENTELRFSQRRCLAHPLKKRNVMERNETLDYCARAAAILNYHKIKDDLADERGAKKLRAVLVYPFVKSARKKALKAGLGELDERIAKSLDELAATEKQGIASVDIPAAIFGDILADITSFGLDGARERIAARIGKSVGKWIYIIDALDDMKEDKEKGRYNPFLLLYGGRLPTENELALVSDALKAGLCSAEEALDLLDTERTTIFSIIENIMYLGLPETADKIICGSPDNTCESREEKGN